MIKIAIVLGTRPEILKNYSIVKSLRQKGAAFCVLHTGQHRDPLMSSQVFKDFFYEPTETFAGPYSFGAALDWLTSRLEALKVDLVLVNGDTAASLIGGLAALYTNRPLAHVEAGLRSYDRRMFEERNRIMVDSIADFLFTYSDVETELLTQRPDLKGSIYKVGNTTVDLIEDFGSKLPRPLYYNYAFITLHRRELVRDPDALTTILNALQDVSTLFKLMIFPVHPHTFKQMHKFGIKESNYPGIRFVKPMLPLSALSHIKHAKLIITDSGVVQEEAYLFGVPCVTVRDNTERQMTVKVGANIVSGIGYDDVIMAVKSSLKNRLAMYPPIYGEPGVGDRITEILLKSEQLYTQDLSLNKMSVSF